MIKRYLGFIVASILFVIILEHVYKKKISKKYYDLSSNKYVALKKTNNSLNLHKRAHISNLSLSEIGCDFLVESLEGSQFKAGPAFLGCGDVVSIGAEYVFKKEDLYNLGLFYAAGYKIEDYIDYDLISYLKRKFKHENSGKVLRLSKKEIKKWEKRKFGIKIFTKKDSKQLFKTYIYNDALKIIELVKVPLYQWEFDAILFTIYNIGIDALKSTDFFDALNNGNKNKAAYILATIRILRLRQYYPRIWNKGLILNDKFLKFIHTFEDLNMSSQNRKRFRNIFKVVKIDFSKLHKCLNRLKKSKLKSIKISSVLSKKDFYYLQNCSKDKETLRELNNILTKNLYIDEIQNLINLKKLDNNNVYSLWKNRISILEFLKEFLKHSFLTFENRIWIYDKISLVEVIDESSHYRKFLKYLYGWCKRDFIHANIFLRDYHFNKLSKPSSHNKILNKKMISHADKFWHILTQGIYKHWIFDCKKLGIEPLYRKYFDALTQQTSNSSFEVLSKDR